ncbi:MAG: aldehyde ferredoxin oxidoreductase family protein [Roseiflexaceae bacterium]
MEQHPFGYHGRVVHVDLGQATSQIETPSPSFWRLYAGGGLLASYYLLKHCPPKADPFDPANPLIVTSSVIAGHPYAGLARCTFAAKSPLTNGVGETRCEGPFGSALKQSDFDSLIIHGAATTPSILLIDQGQASIIAAPHLWGLSVGETVDHLEATYGQAIATAVIGPAGENRVRYASIVTNRGHQAARMGIGAVMGSKQLKAIVLRGGQFPAVADPARCAALTEAYRQRMTQNPLTTWQFEPPGFAAWVHTHGIDAALCTRNYRDSVFEMADSYRPELFLRRTTGLAACPGCPNDCIKIYASDDPARDDPRAGAIHQEITGALGSNLGIGDVDLLFRMNILCNQLGLDPTSLGFTISMAMECAEHGILAEAPRFGQALALPDLITQIAYRQGLGDLLAEGAQRAAAAIGQGAERFALHVKGLELVPFEPRTQTNLALGYAVAPIGPRYDICEHDWDYDTRVGWPHTLDHSRTIGIVDRIAMEEVSTRKVRNYKALNTLWSAADALDLCIFAIAPTRVFSVHEMAELLAAITGWDTSSYELMRYGERRNHLMQVFNRREGLTAAADTLPDRFFDDPIPEGIWQGTRLDRAAFHGAIRSYYRMMGWDEQGHPLYETLIDQHLEWVVADGHAPLL